MLQRCSNTAAASVLYGERENVTESSTLMRQQSLTNTNRRPSIYSGLSTSDYPEDSEDDTNIKELERIKAKMAKLADRRRELKRTVKSDTVDVPPTGTPARSQQNMAYSRGEIPSRGTSRGTPREPPLPPMDGPVRNNRGVNRRRIPRTAAVTITNLDNKVTYADILKKARSSITLEDLGIEQSRIRKGINGGVIIEIPGNDGAAKADVLVDRLRKVLDPTSARVSRPTAMGEIRVWNLDDSISPLEVTNSIAIAGDCNEGDIKLGQFRSMTSGLFSVWAKCPLAAADRAAASVSRKIEPGTALNAGIVDTKLEAAGRIPVAWFVETPNREAQDLLIRHSEELGAAVCVVSEPARIPDSQQCFCSRNGLAAVYINTRIARSPAIMVAQGAGSVLVKYDDVFIASCYVSPNIGAREYAAFLDKLSVTCSGSPNNGRLLVCGDFNAHSRFWGSNSTNCKGDLLEDWTAQLDLRLVNTGNTHTFVGHQGSSIVDLTWVSPDLVTRVRDWSESIEWTCAVTPKSEEYMTRVKPDKWIHQCVTDACLAAVPRVSSRGRGPQVYWWNANIASLRREAIGARRVWTRGRTRDTHNISERKRSLYMAANKALKNAIKKSKSDAWHELVGTLNEDPWGLPYKTVLSKLRKPAPGLSVTLEPEVLNTLLDKLFPPGDPLTPLDLGDCEEGRLPVTVEEVKTAISAKKNSGTAPGPDGFKATTLKMMPPSMIARLAQIFNIYLKYGVFPSYWKTAELILIPKGEFLLGEAPKARPICLLNEVGKTFERVIANRLTDFMEENPDADLSKNQFGFRRAHSTTDALFLVKSTITEAPIRTIMGYQTVSYEAATLLARVPPIHLYADYCLRVYNSLREMKGAGTFTSVSPKEVRAEEGLYLRRRWAEYIRSGQLPGRRTLEAIGPNFDAWLDRSTGFLSFHVTQLLTGHGCFGVYLFRIGKEETPICRFCGLAEDTAEHTLATCACWGAERGELTEVIGQDLSLTAVVAAICDSSAAWRAFSTYAERVMSRKEEEERRRQQNLRGS
ncbi:uncharacterized protein [Temnothorax nylanderi]|uniref:uncharacterized protein n=1 Tax=Temnothorax nylanderi TaxID=102681 RepID=UPI003A8C0676